MIDAILHAINLKPEGIRLYRILLESGAMTAGALAKLAGLARPSVYDHLKQLQVKGLARQSMRFGVKRFHAARPEQIGLILDERIEHLSQQKTAFTKILPELNDLGEKSFISPHFQLFEGPDGIRQVMSDVLLYRNIETRSFWPIQTMLDALSPAFLHDHNKKRIENGISIKAIWPHKRAVSLKDYPFMGAGKAFLREIRIAPDMVDMRMGYWIYGHKTALLSSKAEHIGFIIESAEFAEMMTTQHDVLWRLSKKLPVNPDDVRPFLREIGIQS